MMMTYSSPVVVLVPGLAVVGAGVGAGVVAPGAAFTHLMVHRAPLASFFLLEVNLTLMSPLLCWAFILFFLNLAK